MQFILDWITNNISVVISMGLGLVEFILLIIIKRNKTTIVDDGVYNVLVSLIRQAEKIFGAGLGDKKLNYVLNAFIEKFPKYKGLENIIQTFIEDILSTPQKKGVNDGKE